LQELVYRNHHFPLEIALLFELVIEPACNCGSQRCRLPGLFTDEARQRFLRVHQLDVERFKPLNQAVGQREVHVRCARIRFACPFISGVTNRVPI
jgi:hypothetical protein